MSLNDFKTIVGIVCNIFFITRKKNLSSLKSIYLLKYYFQWIILTKWACSFLENFFITREFSSEDIKILFLYVILYIKILFFSK